MPVGDDTDFINELIANRGDRNIPDSGTHRSRTLDICDRTKRGVPLSDPARAEANKQEKFKLCKNGNIYYINTDQNTYGCGSHILESAKNIEDDLAKILHFRLPATTLQEIKNKEDVWDGELRNLKEINEAWQTIFGQPINRDNEFENLQRSIKSVFCNNAGQTKFLMKNLNHPTYQPKYLSSGENEAFFVLATIISCKLYNCVLLLDEPELHMHLTQQIKYYKCLKAIFDKYDIQAIIITHSHFIVDKILSDYSDEEKEKYGEIDFDQREQKAQIRELLATPKSLTVYSGRREIVNKTLSKAVIYFDGYPIVACGDKERADLVKKITVNLDQLTMEEVHDAWSFISNCIKRKNAQF